MTGAPVTVDQAKEIIFRTDRSIRSPSSWNIGGNDKQFRNKLVFKFGWNLFEELHELDDARRKKCLAEPQMELELVAHLNAWELQNEWSARMGMISTEYVYNSFLSTAYIGGPAGWCNPDGRVQFENHNYGKWPSVEEILKDWQALATAFPFIDLVNTLYDNEHCESNAIPVCSIVVKDGTASVHEPDETLHERMPNMNFDLHLDNLAGIMHGNYSFERGWPTEWIEEFSIRSQKITDQIFSEHHL